MTPQAGSQAPKKALVKGLLCCLLLALGLTSTHAKAYLETNDLPLKNRVWENFSSSPETSWGNELESKETQGKNGFSSQKAASGVSLWTQRDPIGESGGVNLYAFVSNNSLNAWDRLGLAERGPFKTRHEAIRAAAPIVGKATEKSATNSFLQYERLTTAFPDLNLMKKNNTGELRIVQPDGISIVGYSDRNPEDALEVLSLLDVTKKIDGDWFESLGGNMENVDPFYYMVFGIEYAIYIYCKSDDSGFYFDDDPVPGYVPTVKDLKSDARAVGSVDAVETFNNFPVYHVVHSHNMKFATNITRRMKKTFGTFSWALSEPDRRVAMEMTKDLNRLYGVSSTDGQNIHTTLPTGED